MSSVLRGELTPGTSKPIECQRFQAVPTAQQTIRGNSRRHGCTVGAVSNSILGTDSTYVPTWSGFVYAWPDAGREGSRQSLTLREENSRYLLGATATGLLHE